ncbi:hypothetical protein ACO34A_07360 [Rhizobium sp. ACO-34A]|nr:hypothetical protein [Rhizobium sp. ACO-34A]ATN33623.1 hypothetical protein ACO34A_07360 [Rhizobium sp. ACO-34A]
MSAFDLNFFIRVYEDALSRTLIPSCIVGTSSETMCFEGNAAAGRRDLLQVNWLVRDADPLLVRGAEIPVSFSDSLAFILNRTYESEYLTALRRRFFCLEVLSGTGMMRKASPKSALRRMDRVDDLLRWCNANAVQSFAALTTNHFDQFADDVRSGDIVDFLPVISWLDELLELPGFELPKLTHGRKFRLQWAKIASILGVTAKSLAHSSRFENAFKKRFPLFMEKEGIDPEIVAIRVNDLRHTNGPANSGNRFRGWETLDRLTVKNILLEPGLNFHPEFPVFKFSSKGKRTSALYPHDMMRLLSAAAQWVITFSPYILRALELRSKSVSNAKDYASRIASLHRQLDIDWPEELPKLSLVLSSKIDVGERLPLSTAVSMLYVACAMVIGIFTARRRGEVESLTANCLSTGPTGLMFSIYIEKTIRAVDAIPVPDAVRSAIELLEKLSEPVRMASNSPFLFRFKSDMGDGKTMLVDTRFANRLVEFATIAGVPPPADSHVWQLNFHMYRKGFVISFYHGNLWRSFDATSWMLRHSSADMTGIYMDDDENGAVLWLRTEVQRRTAKTIAEMSEQERKYLEDAQTALKDRDELSNLWNEVRQEFFVKTMMDIYDGFEKPIGRGAARLLDALSDMESTAYARIRMSAIPTNGEEGARADVIAQVTKFVASNFLEPVPGVPVYCNFKRGSAVDAAAANCLAASSLHPQNKGHESTHQEKKPNYAFSGAHPCIGCPLAVLLSANQAEVKIKIEEMQSEVKFAATPGLAAGASKIVDDILTSLKQAEAAVDGKQRYN